MASRQESAIGVRSMSRLGRTGFGVPVVLVAGLLVLGGCGKGRPASQEVSGQVAFQKQPLRKGLIEFIPANPGGTSAGAVIRDGRYTVRPEAGLLPGNYRVRIVPKVPMRADWDESTEKRPPGPSHPIQIPDKYNINSVLTAEVKAEGRQTIDFNLD
jgi:hypothetical protein